MTEIGIFDAKTRFSELIEQVSRTGEAITVTKRGKPVAQITPAPLPKVTLEERKAAFASLKALRATLPPLKPGQVRKWIDEGRA